MKISDEFHIWYEKERIWEKSQWLGVETWKLPFDAWIFQELICNIEPDFIVETGTGFGGSAIFYASILELLGHGQVITVDIENKVHLKNVIALKLFNKRVTFLKGRSLDFEVFNFIHQKVDNAKVMVVLDSWHTKEYVLQEMNLYEQLVSIGSYLVVEDTHINGHPVPWEHGDGPMEAVQEFLTYKRNWSFVIDKIDCEKFGMTFNPSGWLRRRAI